MKIKYFGWSSISIETKHGNLFFDPFFRSYCGVQWFDESNFLSADYICVTHGHEEHFLDVPALGKATGARLIGSPSLCRFLKKRYGFDDEKLIPINPASFDVSVNPGFKITALPWKRRDINLFKALTKAVFQGNVTQLAWACSSAVNAPFYSPYYRISC